MASAGAMALLAATVDSSLAVVVLAVASLIAVADNGLGVTAVAEAGGRYWAGRALGVHSTGQLLVSSGTPPLLAILLGSAGYGAVFCSVGALPLLAVWTLPVREERRATMSIRGNSSA